MSPQVEISSETTARLQKYAVPLVDNYDSVINRIIDLAESKASVPLDHGVDSPIVMTVEHSANLTHTKILSAQVGGETVASDWNSIMRAAVKVAALKLKDLEAVRSLIEVQCSKTEKSGYYFVPEANLYIQGQNANKAWKVASNVLNKVKVSADIMFMWYNKSEAAHPGVTAKFSLK